MAYYMSGLFQPRDGRPLAKLHIRTPLATLIHEYFIEDGMILAQYQWLDRRANSLATSFTLFKANIKRGGAVEGPADGPMLAQNIFEATITTHKMASEIAMDLCIDEKDEER